MDAILKQLLMSQMYGVPPAEVVPPFLNPSPWIRPPVGSENMTWNKNRQAIENAKNYGVSYGNPEQGIEAPAIAAPQDSIELPPEHYLRVPQQEAPFMQPEAAQEQPESPIERGSMSGLKAAKQALKMDEEEQRRALGLAIMNFFGNQKPGQGGTLASLNAALPGAAQTYVNEENRVAQQNAALMQYLANAESKRIEAMRKAEKDAVDKWYKMQQIQQKGKPSFGNGVQDVAQLKDGTPIDLTDFNPLDKAQYNDLGDAEVEQASVLKEIEGYIKNLEKLEELSKGDILNVTKPWEGTAAEIGTNIGAFFGKEESKDKRKLIQQIRTQEANIRAAIEGAKKGGATTNVLIKLWENKLYGPHLVQGSEIAKAKAIDMRDDLARTIKAAQLSRKYGRLITANDLAKVDPDYANKEANKEQQEQVKFLEQKAEKYLSTSDGKNFLLRKRAEYPNANNISDKQFLAWLIANGEAQI